MSTSQVNAVQFVDGMKDALGAVQNSSRQQVKRFYRDARDSAVRMRPNNQFGARAYFLEYAWALSRSNSAATLDLIRVATDKAGYNVVPLVA